MIYGFDTKNEHAALAALVVYGIYRSRDTSKFKVTPDMWGTIERAAKSCAKRSEDLNDFIDKFKRKMHCSTIRPQHMMAHAKQQEILVPDGFGGFVSQTETGKRDFWLKLVEEGDNPKSVDELYRHTAFVIILVRDRLEREKYLRDLGKLDEDEGDE